METIADALISTSLIKSLPILILAYCSEFYNTKGVFDMKRYNITVNGKTYDVAVEEVGVGTAPAAPAAAPKAAAPAPAAPSAPAKAAVGEGTAVKAPMPGNILDVKVNVGDTVTVGQVLVILEALKMENEIVATAAGKITSLGCKKGDTVNSDDIIATIA